jgi:hypothetical protein
VLSKGHESRNIAEYEGAVDLDEFLAGEAVVTFGAPAMGGEGGELESRWEEDLVWQARAVQTPSADAPGCRGIPLLVLQQRRPGAAARAVSKAGAAAKVWLQPVHFAYSHGFTPSQLKRIRELVFEHQASFVERWHEYFGR